MPTVLHIIYLSCLLASALIALLYRKDLKSRQLTSFIPFLLLISAQELIVFFYTYNQPGRSTALVYNIYTPVTTLFFAWFYMRIPFNAPARGLIKMLALVFMLAVVITYSFIKSIYSYNTYISLAGGLLNTLCAILFLFNYFKLDSNNEERKWLPVVWITIGIAAFYPVVNISFALYKYLLAYEATIFGMKLYRLIPQLMSIFMYSCFTRAFYLCKKKS
jgi:hypothetical protein